MINKYCIGDNELFEATHIDLIPCEYLAGKIKIISLDEYQDMGITDLLTFYTRARYNPLKRTLTPPFKEWPTLWVCKKPANPNMFYIGWESCEEWFHPLWVGMTNEEAKDIDKFFCSEWKVGSKKKQSSKNAEEKNESKNKSPQKSKDETKSKSSKKEKSAKKEKRSNSKSSKKQKESNND